MARTDCATDVHTGDALLAKEASTYLPDNDDGERIFRRDLQELKELGLDISSVKVSNEERYRLHIVDHRMRAAATREERHELFRVAQRAGLGALYDDLTPGEADVANAPEARAQARRRLAWAWRSHL